MFGQLLTRGIVHFNTAECGFIETLACRRDGIKAQYGLQTSGTYFGLDETSHMHILNAFGEFAVACLYGGEVDEHILVAGSRRGNVLLRDGSVRGQVIARGERGRDFALKSDDPRDFYAPLGFLVWPVREYYGSGQTVQVVGWISRAEFVGIAKTATLNGTRLLVTYGQMHRVSEPLRVSTQTAAQQPALFD